MDCFTIFGKSLENTLSGGITGGCRIHTSNIIRIVRDVRLPHAYRARARDPTEILRKKVSRDMADVADEAEYIADPPRRVAIRRLDRSV